MIISYKELYIRMDYLSKDKNNYKIYQKLSLKFDDLKQILLKSIISLIMLIVLLMIFFQILEQLILYIQN